MGLFGRLFSGYTARQNKALSKEILGDHRVKLQYQLNPTDPPIRWVAIGTPITRDGFAEVKAILQKYNKYLSVREIAKLIGLGKSTIYRIRAARSYKEYKDDSK